MCSDRQRFSCAHQSLIKNGFGNEILDASTSGPQTLLDVRRWPEQKRNVPRRLPRAQFLEELACRPGRSFGNRKEYIVRGVYDLQERVGVRGGLHFATASAPSRSTRAPRVVIPSSSLYVLVRCRAHRTSSVRRFADGSPRSSHAVLLGENDVRISITLSGFAYHVVDGEGRTLRLPWLPLSTPVLGGRGHWVSYFHAILA